MSEGTVIEIGKNAMTVMLMVGAPALIVSLVVGLIVSVFQAATQINESTLSFVPKMLAVFVVLGLCGPWMITNLLDYTTKLFNTMAVIATK